KIMALLKENNATKLHHFIFITIRPELLELCIKSRESERKKSRWCSHGARSRDADGMRRSRMDGCLSPSTIDDERRQRQRWGKPSSVSIERGLDVRFCPTEFLFARFSVVPEIRTPAASGEPHMREDVRELRASISYCLREEYIWIKSKARERERLNANIEKYA
ncbi:hypothetical protein X777_14501, partial [Ooceraea biroi]